MFRPDVPLIIMRRQDLSYNEKSFLLWCWINKDSDKYYILMSREQDRADRNMTWYADYFGVAKQTMYDVFSKLRSKSIVKTEHHRKFKEITYVNFEIFK